MLLESNQSRLHLLRLQATTNHSAAFADVGWASDKNNRKSTTGYVFFVAGGTVS
jgi:hypothetical protein